MTATDWKVPTPVSILSFDTSEGERQVGLAYRDFACLGFVFFIPAIGYETWGALVIDRILLEIKLVFVFQCYMLVYWGGKKNQPKQNGTDGKKKIWFLMGLRDRALRNWICQAGVGRISTTPVVRKAHTAVELIFFFFKLDWNDWQKTAAIPVSYIFFF